jgi:hypothetical protein
VVLHEELQAEAVAEYEMGGGGRMKIGTVEIVFAPYLEKELIGKRFILALLLVGLFAYGYVTEGILGAVIGYYFGSHSTVTVAEAA